MATPLRRLLAVLTLAFGLLTASALPAFALDDPEDGPEPPPFELTAAVVLLRPGELACTNFLFANAQARFTFQLTTSGGTPQRRAKFTLRHALSQTSEEVVFFSRLDPTPAGITGVFTIPVPAGFYRACVRNPTASAVNMSVNGTLTVS